jgi:hypothetical protein
MRPVYTPDFAVSASHMQAKIELANRDSHSCCPTRTASIGSAQRPLRRPALRSKSSIDIMCGDGNGRPWALSRDRLQDNLMHCVAATLGLCVVSNAHQSSRSEPAQHRTGVVASLTQQQAAVYASHCGIAPSERPFFFKELRVTRSGLSMARSFIHISSFFFGSVRNAILGPELTKSASRP